MSEVIDATFEDGVFKPDTPIHLPPKARVRLVVEVDGDTRSEIDRYRNSEERKAGAEQFLALIRASRGGRLPSCSSRAYLGKTLISFPLLLPTPRVLYVAVDLADRYSLSHWDGMLVAARLGGDVDTLYSEDMGAPRNIDVARLVNSFVEIDQR